MYVFSVRPFTDLVSSYPWSHWPLCMDHAVKTVFTTEKCTVLHVIYSINPFILLHEKFLQFDWLRSVVFQLNSADVNVWPLKSALFKMTVEELNFFSIVFLLLLVLDSFLILLIAKINLWFLNFCLLQWLLTLSLIHMRSVTHCS